MLKAWKSRRAGGDAPMFDQMFNGLNLGAGSASSDVPSRDPRRCADMLRSAARSRMAISPPLRDVPEYDQHRHCPTAQARSLQEDRCGRVDCSLRISSSSIRSSPRSTTATTRTAPTTTHCKRKSPCGRRTASPIRRLTRGAAVSALIGSVSRRHGIRDADYTLQSTHRTHDFRSYGTFELPFGPGKLLARQQLRIGWRG